MILGALLGYTFAAQRDAKNQCKRLTLENTELRQKISKLKKQKHLAYQIADEAQKKVEAGQQPLEHPDVQRLLEENNAWRLKVAELSGAYYYVALKTRKGDTQYARVSTN